MLFRRIGESAYRRRRLVAFVWLSVLVAGVGLYGLVVPRLTADGGSPDTESGRVYEQLREIRRTGVELVAVVDSSPLDDPSVAASVRAATADVAGLAGVTRVVDFYSTGAPQLRSADGTSSLVVVGVADGLPHKDQAAVVDRVAERLRAIEAPGVRVGGEALLDKEFQTAVEKDLSKETLALPVALVAMVIILGGFLAASMPMLVAFGSVAGSMAVLFTASRFMTMSVYSINVVFMLGLGLGIDYGLLAVSRFREERAAGAELPDAVANTVATAGRTIVFSALTVAVALAGLFAFRDPEFRSFGVAGVGVVLVAAVAGVTLLPALLGLWGHRLRPARTDRGDHGWFARVASLVQRRAVPVVAVVGFGLAVLAIPFLGARFQNGDARYLPRSSETRAVAMELAARFPAKGADPVQVVALTPVGDPALAAYLDTVRTRSDVADVTVWPDTPAGTTVIDVVPRGSAQSDTAQSLVRQLRADEPGFTTQVGGVAGSLVDSKDATASRLPIAAGVIVVATFVLLFLMTGSLAVPVKAIIMNVLSLGASFGALVLVFQDGHLAKLLGFDPVGSLDLFMPVLIFIFAFGLSMDYEVFLLARIKEIHDQTGDNDTAVRVGLQRTGRIITSAAFLIVVVFAGFASGQVLGIKELGFGMALAIIVDATVVRTLLVPATMRLLGEWNWWAPAPLRRFHQRFGLHEAPSMLAAREVAAASPRVAA